MATTYTKIEEMVDREVDEYECGNCDGTFLSGNTPKFCPRCGESFEAID
jgi:rubrerythrin